MAAFSLLPLFDLHCDTLYELYKQNLSFDNDKTMINQKTAALFLPYRQIFAFWSDNKLTPEEQWENYLSAVEYKKTSGLPEGAILAVEGGSLLDGKLGRLERLASDGVKALTLVWSGHCCIGGACGTDEGFSDFGFEVYKKCAEYGIAADFSHASDKMIGEALASPYPMICTHSNSRAVTDHPRNLTDEQFCGIIKKGGVVGLCMASAHIGGERTFDRLVDHYVHYLSLGGEDHVCLGCDLDGFIGAAPAELTDQSSLYLFADALQKRGIGKALIKKLFYDNAFRYFDSLFGQTCQKLL